MTDAAALSDTAMLGLARRFGLDTVFILPAQRGGSIRMRYFVPDHEMGVSGHATIAGVSVAVGGRSSVGRILVETITGDFDVTVIDGEHDPLVTLEQLPPTFGKLADPTDVARVLNIEPSDVVTDRGPVQSVSVSRPKLIVPLKDWRILNSLKPDYDALWCLCESTGVTGIYPFTRQTNKLHADVEARQFPLRAGFLEDAATGVAAGALGGYFAKYDTDCAPGQYYVQVAQGYAMGAPSSIQVIVENRDGTTIRTAVQGSARVVTEEEIAI